MEFTTSLLPTTPSRYALNNASMTESTIEIQPFGGATVQLTKSDIETAPENMKVTIIADKYTDAYNPQAFVDIQVYDENTSYSFLCPIVDTGNGIFTTEIELSNKLEYLDFVFTIRSAYAMKILSWELAGPASTSEEYIEEMRKELPRLLRDYNEMPYIVGQTETTVCLISAFLVKNTDLNGHLQVSYRATEDCQVIMRAKDNDVTELFSPVVIDIKAGRGSIDIPHAYVEKFIGYHTFTCTLQVTNGTLKIPTRAVLYTVDGGHLAERVMDVGMDVRDIAMRRTERENNPSWIYAIGIDDGKALVKARPYSDVANTAWEPMFIVGENIVEAAIEFDGKFHITGTAYRFDTFDTPWVFWVDINRILYAQEYQDEGSRIELATGVSKITTVRGFRNTEYVDNDQGLVVMYIKDDGLVYYRSYCLFLNLEDRVWENERRITQFNGHAVDVYAFRTNDYRTGFNITDDTGRVTTLITTRTWVGMASPIEYVMVGVKDLAFKVTPVDTYVVATPTHTVEPLPPPAPAMIPMDKRRVIPDEQLLSAVESIRFFVCPPTVSPMPEITNVERLAFTDNKTIQLSFNYPLVCDLDRLISKLDLVSTSGMSMSLANLEQNDNVLTIRTVNEMRVVDNYILTYSDISSYYLAMRINDTCVIDYGKPINLSILGLPPSVQENIGVSIDATFTVTEITEIPVDTVESVVAAITDIAFVVTEVDTLYGYLSENVVVGIADIMFTVTQTSTSPI